jgi:urease accessory protein
MRNVKRIADDLRPDEAAEILVLDFDARQKHRFLARLSSGEEVSVLLPRGTLLYDGDELEVDDGTRIRVRAADEPLSVVETDDPLLFSRITYHLGNRHVPLQIAELTAWYPHDHVLDDMVRRLGATVRFEKAPFSPERGAYGHGAVHSHDHAHHHHDHDHDHAHHHHDHDHE